MKYWLQEKEHVWLSTAYESLAATILSDKKEIHIGWRRPAPAGIGLLKYEDESEIPVLLDDWWEKREARRRET